MASESSASKDKFVGYAIDKEGYLVVRQPLLEGVISKSEKSNVLVTTRGTESIQHPDGRMVYINLNAYTPISKSGK